LAVWGRRFAGLGRWPAPDCRFLWTFSKSLLFERVRIVEMMRTRSNVIGWFAEKVHKNRQWHDAPQ
jgi:hypothetical protein